MPMQTVIFLAVGLVVGLAGGYVLRKALAIKSKDQAEVQAQHIVGVAKNEEKDILLKAKEQAIKVIEDAKREEGERRKEVAHLQERLEKREATFDQKLLELESQKQKTEEEKQKFEAAREEVKKIREEQMQKLEKIAGLTQDEAKRVLFENAELLVHDRGRALDAGQGDDLRGLQARPRDREVLDSALGLGGVEGGGGNPHLAHRVVFDAELV